MVLLPLKTISGRTTIPAHASLCGVSSLYRTFLLMCVVCALIPSFSSAQIMNSTDPSKDPVVIAQGGNPVGMLIINIVGEDGVPLKENGVVTLLRAGEVSGPNQLINGSGAVRFTQLANANYTVIVSVVGYKDAREEADITSGMTVSEVTVTLERSTDPAPNQDGKGMFLVPKAKKEAQKGLDALRAGNYDDARKHLTAAYQLAPGNPDLNDRMGELFLVTKNYDKAQTYLDQALSIDPQNASALTDMGWLRVQQGNNAGAEETLQRAVTVDPNRWFTHWLLGLAYLRQLQFEQARTEADAAIKVGKGQAADAEYLLGESLAALGRSEEAITALQGLLKDAPSNSNAASAQALITRLQAGPLATAQATSTPASAGAHPPAP